eukprot:TRINITY_DN13428_c3_g1_i1.p1 TRINITY_DN13428_c3_g1~~TRINITY_DN13428_c3_g1_i1.p1  ORF type:complete len:128 (-),score=8.11 TRINITY_DN13428_c3_g1_i1:300-683(-)
MSVSGKFGDGESDPYGVGVWQNIEFDSGQFGRSHAENVRGSDYGADERSGGVNMEASGTFSVVSTVDGSTRVKCQVERVFTRLMHDSMIRDIGAALVLEFKEGYLFEGVVSSEGFTKDCGLFFKKLD